MKKSSSFALLFFSVILILLTITCTMDLEPAKSGNTTLSISIGTLLPSITDDSRAVVPDYGYLYIRTVGGPTASNGPFYGPYEISNGTTFTTTEIPAGSYESITLLYASELLDGRFIMIGNDKHFFQEFMNLPDSKFKEFSGKEDFSVLLNGYASGKIITGVSIKPNKINTISATLLPFCGADSFNLDGMFETKMFSFENAGTLIRRFVRVEGVHAPSGTTIEKLVCTIKPKTGKNSVVVGKTLIYSSDGKLVKNITNGETIIGSKDFEIPYTSGSSFYLYFECDTEGLDIELTTPLVPKAPYTSILYVHVGDPGTGASPKTPMTMSQLSNAPEFNSENTVVLLTQDVESFSQISVGDGRKLLFASLTQKANKIYLSDYYSYIIVNPDTSLTLSNIIIDGKYMERYFSLVNVSGSFTMEGGAVLQNNANTAGPGGVQINTGGSFTMEDGTIKDCTGSNGGGVSVIYGGTFTMNGGSITNCTASYNGGAVYVEGTMNDYANLIIAGGKIENCTASTNGGAVYVQSSTFDFQSGSISGCLSDQGGGLYLSSGVTFTYGNFRITGCSAVQGGGIAYFQGVITVDSILQSCVTGNEATGGNTEYDNFFSLLI